VTKITGIGNQRMKECNRIEKVVQILNSFHVIAYELEDGIAIMSNPSIVRLSNEIISVPTYSDHRIAMAFTILSSAI
jgi:pentafunctional AROM polypeptide